MDMKKTISHDNPSRQGAPALTPNQAEGNVSEPASVSKSASTSEPANASKPAIKIKGLVGGYTRSSAVFNGLDISVPRGKLTAIAGPNGSGKSTLFRFLLKSLKPRAGRIIVDGIDISKISQKELARLVSFVPQFYLVPEGFTVEQFISMSDFAGRSCTPDDIDAALEEAGIAQLRDRIASELSGGETQLVMLARAICCRTPIILMDEPTSNLDINRQTQLLRTVRRLADNGKTILCALHDLNSILRHADSCIILSNGRPYACGSPEEVITEEMLSKVFDSDAKIIKLPDCKPDCKPDSEPNSEPDSEPDCANGNSPNRHGGGHGGGIRIVLS